MSVFFLGGCSETENELGSINNDKGELESSYKIQINHFDSEPVSKNECKLKYKDVGYSVKFVPALDFLERKGTKVEKEDLPSRSEEHTSELQSRPHLVCRLLLEKKKKKKYKYKNVYI